MATAKTPSLNASRRCLLIRDLRLSRSSTTHLCCRISDVNDRLQTINAALIPSLPALCPPEPEPAGLQDAGAERPASGRAFSLPFEVGVDGANGLRGFNPGAAAAREHPCHALLRRGRLRDVSLCRGWIALVDAHALVADLQQQVVGVADEEAFKVLAWVQVGRLEPRLQRRLVVRL